MSTRQALRSVSRPLTAARASFGPAAWTLFSRAFDRRQQRLLHEGLLNRLELGIYHVIVVPLVAFLPAAIAYRVACLQGDLRYVLDRRKRGYILEGLEGALGDQMSPPERAQVTRDFFRVNSCRAVDIMRLAGNGSALSRLVEIRGLEHVEAALAAGKGAILCGAHFGSYDAMYALIGAHGFPVTAVGRTPSKLNKNRTFAERLVFRLLIRQSLAHHLRRANIEPRGQLEAAVQAADVLRSNELLSIAIDPPALPADRTRAVPVPFLGGQALLIPGATMLASLTGAPILMVFLRRTPDWHHQILDISPPIPTDEDERMSFQRCVAPVEAAIRRDPAHWHYWGKYALIDLGLLPPDR